MPDESVDHGQRDSRVGVCGFCGREIKVRPSGKLWPHRHRGLSCPGSGDRPYFLLVSAREGRSVLMGEPNQPQDGPSVSGVMCHDCGAELRKPSDLMRHKCPIALARAIRLGNDENVAPSRLFALCRGNGALYNHAMREAGYIVQKATGEPENPCSICGWSPDA